VSGSSKQLHDEHVHEAIKEDMESSDSDADEGGIVMHAATGGGLIMSSNKPQMQTLSGEYSPPSSLIL